MKKKKKKKYVHDNKIPTKAVREFIGPTDLSEVKNFQGLCVGFCRVEDSREFCSDLEERAEY